MKKKIWGWVRAGLAGSSSSTEQIYPHFGFFPLILVNSRLLTPFAFLIPLSFLHFCIKALLRFAVRCTKMFTIELMFAWRLRD